MHKIKNGLITLALFGERERERAREREREC